MDIAAISMQMSMDKTMQGVEIALLKKTMDSQEMMAQTMIQEMMPTPQPSFGHKLDVII